jgi:hypothetical protein
MTKNWSLLTGVRQLLAMVSLLAAAAITSVGRCDAASVRGIRVNDADTMVFSDWHGGCSVSRLADVSCTMYREARSAAGQRLGLVALGEQESSRFLFVGLELAEPARSQALAVEIDGQRLAKGEVSCRGGDTFCSATIAVDRELLKRLSSAHVLTVVDRSSKKTLLNAPLDGFAEMRAYGL